MANGKKGVSTGVAAAAGALFGAATSAAAIFLSDKKNRQKVERKIEGIAAEGKKAVKKTKKVVRAIEGKSRK